MLYIVWSKENQLEIPIIDEQHRGIVSAINSLYFFIRQGSGAEALKPTLDTLMGYTNIHFKVEEGLMEAVGYPLAKEHSKLHKALAEKAFAIGQEALRSGDASSLLHFLKTWWMEHINRVDRKYAPFLQSPTAPHLDG